MYQFTIEETNKKDNYIRFKMVNVAVAPLIFSKKSMRSYN